jgi:hypothetical protein
MLLVVTAVARHGKLVPTRVRVHALPIPWSPKQFGKLAPVIVATAALSTVTLNDDCKQDVAVPNAGIENPKLLESILPAVPTGAQLAADATDAITNAYDASTTPKSNTLFLETICSI